MRKTKKNSESHGKLCKDEDERMSLYESSQYSTLSSIDRERFNMVLIGKELLFAFGKLFIGVNSNVDLSSHN